MIKCELTSQIVELAPGGSTAVVLTLTNQSEIIDDFQVSFQPVFTPETVGMNPAWLTLSPVQFTLRPIPAGRGPVMDESQRTVRLNVKLPPDIEAGSYAGMIIVTAKSGAGNSAQLPFNLVVSENSQQELELLPKEQTSRRRTEIYRVNLVNRGNAPHTYAVYAEDDQDECLFDVRPNEVTLLPREEAAFTLRVRPRRRNWTDDDQRYQFQVKLEGYDSYQSGLFVQRCALPPVRWIQRHWVQLGFIFAFLFALLVAAFIFLFPLFSKEVKAAFCGPVSERYVAVTSDNLNTVIRVSGRGGSEADQVRFQVPSITMPGVFSSLISISPDGRRLAYVKARNLALDDAHIVVVDLLNTDPVRGPAVIVDLPVPNGMWPTAPVWSSNGQKLAFFKRPDKPAQADATAATTAAATTANPNATGSPSASGTVSTTEAVTTAAPTTAASGTPGATIANVPGQLELWMADAEAGKDPPKKLAATSRLTTSLFYGLGNHSPDGQVVCWATDNQSILVRPRPDDKAASKQVQLTLDGSKAEEISLKPAVPFIALPTVGAIQALPKAAFLLPAASLIPPPAVQARPSPSPTGSTTKTSPTQAQPPANQSTCPVTKVFSQNDPQWSNLLLKNGNSSKLSEWGCPIVAGAILLGYQGQDTTPAGLNTCLSELGYSLPLNEPGWTAVGQQCGGSQLLNGVRGDFDWAKLDSALENGPAIVGLIGGPSGLHFVVVTSGHDGQASTYGAVDPWDGTTDKTLDDFIGWGYRPRWLISYDQGVGKGCGTGTEADLSKRPAGLGDLRAADNGVQITVNGPADGFMYNEQQNFQYVVTGASSASATISLTAHTNGPITPLRQPLPGDVLPLTDEGVYSILIQARDKSGALLATRHLFFTIDRTLPSVLPSLSPPPADQTNRRSDKPVKLQLTAGDALTGIATIKYQVNSGPWQTYSSDTATEAQLFDKQGTYNIAYYAVDGAGNATTPTFYNFTIAPPGNFVPGANQLTPGSFQSSLTPLPSLPKPGTPAAGQGNNTLPLPTLALAPTSTPKPAVRATLPPLAPVTSPASVVTTTEAAAPATLTPLPTIQSLTPQATTTSEATLTAVPTLTPTPTATPAPVTSLSFSSTQLTFESGVTSQVFKITNNGTVATTWTLTPGDSASLLTYSLTTGYLAPGDSATVTISTVAANQGAQSQATSFQVSAGTFAPQTINVTIKPKPLPTAVLNTSLAVGDSLPLTVTVGVTISASSLTQTPDHALIVATYKTCDTCAPTANTVGRLSALGNPTLVWDTSGVLPQTGIQLGGLICASTDETNCADIPPITDLKITLDASFLTPTASQKLTDTVTIKIQPGGRTKRVILSYTTPNSNGQQFRLTPDASADNNWQVSWNTLNIPPDLQPFSTANPITLLARACNSTDVTAFCQDIPSLTGLFTKMSATALARKADNTPLASNAVLTGTLTIQASNFSLNVDHVTALATYREVGATTATPHAVARISNNGTATWDTTNIPAQNGIILQLLDCYGSDDTWCDQVVSYTGLQITVGAPVALDAPEAFQSALINQPFTNPLRARALDARSNPVPGVQITFTAPTFGSGSTNPSGTFKSNGSTTETVTTDGNGTATSSIFTANSNSGPYSVVVSAPGITQTIDIRLNNNLPNQNQILIVDGDQQTAKITTQYAKKLQVRAIDPNLNKNIQGASLVFEVQNSGNTPGGTFSGSSTITVTTDQDGLASATLTANTFIGKFQVQVSGTGFNPNSFSLTNLKGDPFAISVNSSYVATAPALHPFGPSNSAPSFQATVKDAGGNVLDSVPVTFSAPNTYSAASGTFTNSMPAPPNSPSGPTSATVTTDVNGVASSPPFFANLKLGTYSVAVQAGAVAVGNQINLTNLPGDPSRVTFDTMPTGPLQLKTNVTVSNVFTATVYDQGDNRVPTATVSFSVITGTNTSSGTFASNPATAISNASGLAMLATGYKPNCFLGDYQLQATATSPITVQPGTYALKNIVGGAAKITINGPITQTNTVGSPTPYGAFNVTVSDGCGSPNNPVSGADLTFDVPNTTTQPSGTFSGGNIITTTSAADGTASASGLLPNTVAGQFNLTVTLLNGAQPATAIYTLTNQPDVPNSITLSANTLATKIDQQFTGTGTPLTAVVKDRFGNVVPGVDVTFSTPDPNTTPATATFGGSFKNGTTTHTKTVTTDGTGTASAGSIFASKKAGTYTLNVVAGSATASVTMTNNAGPPDHFVALGGTTYNTTIGTAFTGANFNVRVEDANNNPVAGATVTYTPQVNGTTGATADFHATTCAGAANATFTAISDPSGNVAVTDVLCANTKAGSYKLKVTSGAATALNFNLTNDPGAPDHFAPATGSLSTKVNTKFTGALGVQVQDAGNNPVPGVNVTYTVLPAGGAGASFKTGTCGTPGNGTFSNTSDASGNVAVTQNLCANTTAGTYTLNITGAANPASFGLTNTPDVPSAVTISPTSFNLAVNTGFPNITLTVKDQFGNPIQGATASFSTSGNTNGADVVVGGTPPAASDASGTITVLSTSGYLKANTKAGTYNLNATVTITGNSASTNPDPLVTQTADVPSNITANPAVNTNATVGTAYSPATLSVKVTDQFGNNVTDGTNVTFTAPSSGASGSFGGGATTTVTTNGGIATTGGTFTANNVVGQYEVTATAGAATSPAGSFIFVNKANLATDYNANSATNRNTIAGDTVPIEVQVVDGSNTPVTGGTLTFSVGSAANGQFSNNAQSIAVANTTGTVSANFTTGSTIGQIQITAKLTAATGVTVQKTFTLYNGANIAITGGDGQIVLVNGDTTTTPMTVTVTGNGTFGTGVPGVTVNYAVTSGNGTVGSATTTTDGNGIASTSFTSSSGIANIGSVTVDASITVSASLKPKQTFGLTNSFNFSISGGDGQIAPNGTTFTNTLAVKPVGFGNSLLPGLTVSFAIQGATGATFKQGVVDRGATVTKKTDNTTGIADLVQAPGGAIKLVAGSAANPLQIIATLTQNGVTKTVTFNETVT